MLRQIRLFIWFGRVPFWREASKGNSLFISIALHSADSFVCNPQIVSYLSSWKQLFQLQSKWIGNLNDFFGRRPWCIKTPPVAALTIEIANPLMSEPLNVKVDCLSIPSIYHFNLPHPIDSTITVSLALLLSNPKKVRATSSISDKLWIATCDEKRVPRAFEGLEGKRIQVESCWFQLNHSCWFQLSTFRLTLNDVDFKLTTFRVSVDFG